MTGSGPWTSVSMPYVSGRASDAWGAEAAEHGGRGTQKLLSVEEVAASAMVADMLGLVAGEPVIARCRLMLFNDHPVELVESYYPAGIARGTRLAEARKIPGGAVAFLADLGHPPRRVREDVSARLATAHERTTLMLDDPSCVLLLARALVTENDRPIEASVMTMVAEGRRLRYELTP
ncbi:DNA-binding GntR family transcriptional regulator [Tamaricihabitans halophyticus]|uniref:DNA-binding GntR family transcriptional regulator n=1 Tax=Tamaricihabitans halophyticus TaxID=1262583 RepID=A0A4R2QKX6_9PSEU|nr:UTRA domain-containing protein [Tamaricihabitans halophyticus]TCP50112.1 DNA-binding GntR family transcriptional regulator [Tamaricihabitans halophyticus]